MKYIEPKILKTFKVMRYYGTEETWALVKHDGEFHIQLSGQIYRIKDFRRMVKGLIGFLKFLDSKGVR